MDKIIGLGGAGCNLAKQFTKYPEYEVYQIDCTDSTESNFFQMKEYKTAEDYEKHCPDFTDFFKGISGEALFVLCGASCISGASLRILQQLKEVANVSILYIRPDVSLLDDTRKKQERITYQVLKNYVRSTLFEQMYIVDNQSLEEIVDGAPIIGFYDKLNELAVTTVHMINIFNNSKAVAENFSTPHELARISTFGMLDLETDEEKLFFDIEYPREKMYYFAIPDKTLKTDKKLFKELTEKMKSKIEENVNVSYGIYSTAYDVPYVYCQQKSSMIQGE